MKCGSLFSGIGGMDLGLARAGFTHEFFCEQDSYRREILRRHWPDVPVYEDVRTLGPGLPYVDLIAAGFPCQDVSVAGKRRGLAGERTGLFFELTRIAAAIRPEWLCLENVPGLLSSNGGRDFGVVLGELADLGYGLGWRVLDSRFFGVPQRRRRVFILGNIAGGSVGAERCAEVLSLGPGCERHSAKGREAGAGTTTSTPQGVAGTLDRGRRGQRRNREREIVNCLDRMAGGPDDNSAQAGHLIAEP